LLDTDGRPLHVTWRYDRAEFVADAVVHALGIVLGLCGAAAMLVIASRTGRTAEVAAVAIYSVGLIGLFTASALYNMWPVSRTKWVLRRFDHAFIFILIAATYTPFMTRFPATASGIALCIGVWAVAIGGAALKLALPGRFDRFSIVLCLLLGGSGALAWDTVSAALPASTLALIMAGALVYAAGVIFHLWEGLRFQNAVWHGFVLVASAIFYGAILDGVVLA
jgi:hemolysin III